MPHAGFQMVSPARRPRPQAQPHHQHNRLGKQYDCYFPVLTKLYLRPLPLDACPIEGMENSCGFGGNPFLALAHTFCSTRGHWNYGPPRNSTPPRSRGGTAGSSPIPIWIGNGESRHLIPPDG